SGIRSVAGFAQLFDLRFELAGADPAMTPGYLLQACDLQALRALDHADKLPRVDQRFVGAGVQPRRSTPKQFLVKRSGFQIEPVEIRDFVFAASRRLER